MADPTYLLGSDLDGATGMGIGEKPGISAPFVSNREIGPVSRRTIPDDALVNQSAKQAKAIKAGRLRWPGDEDKLVGSLIVLAPPGFTWLGYEVKWLAAAALSCTDGDMKRAAHAVNVLARRGFVVPKAIAERNREIANKRKKEPT